MKIILYRFISTILYLITASYFGYIIGYNLSYSTGGRDLGSRIINYYSGLFLCILLSILIIENTYLFINKIKEIKIVNIVCILSVPSSLVLYILFFPAINSFLPYKAKWLPIQGPYYFITADVVAHLFFILIPPIAINIFYLDKYYIYKKVKNRL